MDENALSKRPQEQAGTARHRRDASPRSSGVCHGPVTGFAPAADKRLRSPACRGRRSVIHRVLATLFVLGSVVLFCTLPACNKSSSSSSNSPVGPPPPPAVTWGIMSYSIGRNECDNV